MQLHKQTFLDSLLSIKAVTVVTVIVSVGAIIVSYHSGKILAYNDATAHLNTARRMIDNLTPGFVQIGSVWLPLLHLLELPFVTNDFLWHSGLAGAIVSGISFVVAAIFLYKLLYLITNNRIATAIGVLFLVSNLNILYLQTTAMFEPLLLATALGAVYYFTLWAKTHLISHLILAAFFTMLATLTRYDGWSLYAAGLGYVLLVGVLTRKRRLEGDFIIYGMLSSFGIGLWLFYNKVIFGDALFFARGEFSAAAQQQVLYEAHSLLTKHNLPLSVVTYCLAVLLNVGVVATALGAIGSLVYLRYLKAAIYFLGPLLLVVPLGFNIISLYLGQSVIWIPMLPPYFSTYFNVRYGILLLPAIAFFVGFLCWKIKVIQVVAPLLLLAQVFLFITPQYNQVLGQPVGLVTLNDTVSSVNAQTLAATSYLHSHYRGGLIMISSASADAFVFRAGLPLKDFITEGTGNYWHTSLVEPDKYATWIVFLTNKDDRVGKAVGNSKALYEHFHLVYQDQTYQMWEKN